MLEILGIVDVTILSHQDQVLVLLQSSNVALLQCYAATLFNVLCNNVITTGGRECVYVHAQNLAKTKEMNCCTK